VSKNSCFIIRAILPPPQHFLQGKPYLYQMPKPFFRILTKKVFIITNSVVGVLFVTGCYGYLLFTNRYWFTGLLTLAAFYLFILLVLFFIFWLLLKSKWSLLFLAITAITYRQIFKIVPFRAGRDFTLLKQKDALRIMSWNVAQFNILNYRKEPAVHDDMIKLVNLYQPDIACFQEMVAGDSIVDLNNAYYRKYAFYSIEDFELSMHFADEYYSYNWKENYLSSQHFGIIIFSKYPIVNRHTITTYPNDYNSIFQYADIVKDNDTVRVFNIHLQSLKFNPVNLQYIDNPTIESEKDLEKSKNILNKFKTGFLRRKLQADRIKEEIEKSPYPVIVCGDFNDVPNSYAYETIGKGLQNTFEKNGSGLGRTFSGIASTLRIDNIFVDTGYSVNQFTRIAKKLSDHFPIISDITKGNQNQ
jgi:endonuclease/exonuclease/phosphatase family metal-dependent hydrolase